MTKHYIYEEKHDDDKLYAKDWNDLAQDVDAAVDAIINGSIGGEGTSNITCTDVTEQGGDPKVSVKVATGIEGFAGDSDAVSAFEFTKKVKNNNYKGTNVSLVSNNNINIEPRESVGSTKGGNISLKPGDDIELCSHHRIEDNQNEVSVKVIDGDDNPVKLQINAASVTMTTKDKQGDDANVLDVNINSGKNTKGYLKVRALAIDLRCEDHGGVALQPKGEDGQGHMNKIKFEHGGGDGLEFGTFNTEKTSIFTDEYRFKKDGIWKMATRNILDNSKDASLPNADADAGNGKYNSADETTHYSYEKQSDDFYDVINVSDETATTEDIIKSANSLFKGTISQKLYTTSVLIDTLPASDPNSPIDMYPTVDSNESLVEIPNADWQYIQSIVTPVLLKDFVASLDEAAGDSNYTMSTTNSILKTVEKVINRGERITVWDSTARKYALITVTPQTISCSISDIISLVNYMKTNNEGPWAPQL